VTCDYINQMYPQRASSGILLILAQVPLFEHATAPLGMKLRTATQTQFAAQDRTPDQPQSSAQGHQ
jgi:hypothetical protein